MRATRRPRSSSRARYAVSCSFPLAMMISPYASSTCGRSSSPRCTRSSSCVRCAQARWFPRSVGERRSVPSTRRMSPQYQSAAGAGLRIGARSVLRPLRQDLVPRAGGVEAHRLLAVVLLHGCGGNLVHLPGVGLGARGLALASAEPPGHPALDRVPDGPPTVQLPRLVALHVGPIVHSAARPYTRSGDQERSRHCCSEPAVG